MGNQHLVYERYIWFDAEIHRNRFPNASTLADHFEISRRTARRNIAFMRDMLDAPLVYDHTRRGYTYEKPFTLPDLPVSQEELLAVLLARNMLEDTESGFIGQAIRRFGRKLFVKTVDIGLSERRVRQCFSAMWHSYSPSDPGIFHKVSQALLTDRTLFFSYHSPQRNQTTQRTVEPHHLQHYMGSWVLLAWCRKRQAWRRFYLARMENVTIRMPFTRRPAPAWRHLLQSGFGIFQGSKTFMVTVRFSPHMARWIHEQIWHPDQVIEKAGDGSLTLTVPVADLREIKMKILQFGYEAEVLAPEELRKQIREEAKRLSSIYSDKKQAP